MQRERLAVLVAARRCKSRVEPSTSLNSIVTVPDGCATMPE